MNASAMVAPAGEALRMWTHICLDALKTSYVLLGTRILNEMCGTGSSVTASKDDRVTPLKVVMSPSTVQDVTSTHGFVSVRSAWRKGPTSLWCAAMSFDSCWFWEKPLFAVLTTIVCEKFCCHDRALGREGFVVIPFCCLPSLLVRLIRLLRA